MNNKRSWLRRQIGSQGLITTNEEVSVKVEQERPRKKLKVTTALRRRNAKLREENEKLKKEVEELKKVISASKDEKLKREKVVDREL